MCARTPELRWSAPPGRSARAAAGGHGGFQDEIRNTGQRGPMSCSREVGELCFQTVHVKTKCENQLGFHMDFDPLL